MNISINVNKAGGFENGVGFNPEEQKKNAGRKSFFVGESALANDPIEQRKKMAQKQAWKVVQDAWENDKAVNESIDGRRAHYEEMKALKEEAQKEVESLAKQERALQEEYGVAEDSKEQQDLELLKKYQDVKNGVRTQSLTEEEMKQVAEIQKEPLTEYQKRALELNDCSGKFRIEMRDANSAMKDDVQDIKSILLEKLKSNPMLEAQQAADDIWGAALEDMMGMAVQEAKEHIDEIMEEQEEKAEKAAEEQEEKDEQLEDLKEKRAFEEALIEGTKEALEEAEARKRQNEAPELDLDEILDATKVNQKTSDVGSSLDEIKASMNLLEADLMGIEVDETV